MDIPGSTLLALAIVLFFGLIIPQYSGRISLPFISSLIILGFVIGPLGLNYVQPNETMTLFGFLGATFHMLLIGFSTPALRFKDMGKRLWVTIGFNTIVPFTAGTLIVRLFNYGWESALFMGAVFISSSIIMAFSDVKKLKIGNTAFGRTMKWAVVIQNLISTLLVFVLFNYIEPTRRFPLSILLGLLISSVVVLRMFLPEIVYYFFEEFKRKKTGHEARIRLVISLLLFTVVGFSAFRIHPFIAAFLVGFTLSEIPHSKVIYNKLHTVGYALFIPVYLFVIGMGLDLSLLTTLDPSNLAILSVILGAIASKFLSSYISGKIVGFKGRETLLLAFSSSSKLTVTISFAFAAKILGIIDNRLYTAIVLLSVITVTVNPIVMSVITKPRNSDK